MYHGRLVLPIKLLACLMVLCAGCASGAGNSTSNAPPLPIARFDSPPIGLVGLLVMDPYAGQMRAAGMKGVMLGYVVSHPALPADLCVPAGRDGHPLPVLAFKLTSVLTETSGSEGPEVVRGHGTLNIFYKPDGFTDALLHDGGALDNTEQVESDHIEFYGSPIPGTNRFYLHLQETVVATHAFVFAGRAWRTPVSRTASDTMVGEYSDSFVGEAYASSGAMPSLSPEEKLIALAGAPHRLVRY